MERERELMLAARMVTLGSLMFLGVNFLFVYGGLVDAGGENRYVRRLDVA